MFLHPKCSTLFFFCSTATRILERESCSRHGAACTLGVRSLEGRDIVAWPRCSASRALGCGVPIPTSFSLVVRSGYTAVHNLVAKRRTVLGFEKLEVANCGSACTASSGVEGRFIAACFFTCLCLLKSTNLEQMGHARAPCTSLRIAGMAFRS